MHRIDPEIFAHDTAARTRLQLQEEIIGRLVSQGYTFSADPLKDLLVAAKIVHGQERREDAYTNTDPADLLIIEGFRRRANREVPAVD